RWEEMLDTCTSSNGTMESANPTFQTEIGLPARINPFDGEQVARLVGGILGRRHFEDSLGGCSFTFRARIELLARALSAATGWNYGLDEAMRFGRRTAAILRAFNLRCGIGTDVEYPSERYGSQPVDGPAKDQSIMKQWDHMLDVWYETVGYDRKTGKPKREMRQHLGRGGLARDVWGKWRLARHGRRGNEGCQSAERDRRGHHVGDQAGRRRWQRVPCRGGARRLRRDRPRCSPPVLGSVSGAGRGAMGWSDPRSAYRGAGERRSPGCGVRPRYCADWRRTHPPPRPIHGRLERREGPAVP